MKQMEMLFLQSAAGMRSNQLDLETLRALCRGGLGDVEDSHTCCNSSDMDGSDRGVDSIEDHVPFLDDSNLKTPLAPEEIVEVLQLTQDIADIYATAGPGTSRPSQDVDVGKAAVPPPRRALSVDVIKRGLSKDSFKADSPDKSKEKTFAMSLHLQTAVELSNKVVKQLILLPRNNGFQYLFI